MRLSTILRILGIFLMVFSLSMLPPVGVSLYYHDGAEPVFLFSYLLSLGLGYALWFPFRNHKQDIKTRDGFLVVVLFWVVLSLDACLPLILATHPHLSLTDALFETISGLTTTGASVLTNLQDLPKSILYYRQQMQFLGGMGIIVLAVAIFPMLGVGGMQLYRAETPGPIKDNKLTPRIAETAKTLWYIYVGLVILCALCYWATGMTLLDAIGESFGTISTGGFSMHDNSFAFYHNPGIELVSVVFMILGATNFGLHFAALQSHSLRCYLKDIEFRAFLYIIVLATFISLLFVSRHHYYAHLSSAFISCLFNVTSNATTTGFISAPFNTWPKFIPVLIMITALIGGCGGSTAGGMKVIRILLLHKQGMREIKRLLHPRAVMILKFGNQLLPENVVQAMWAFIAIYIAVCVFVILALMGTGLNLTTAFGAAVAGLANSGAGIGAVSSTFAHLNTAAKWIVMFAMLAGRLEIFTLFVIFTPGFWRR